MTDTKSTTIWYFANGAKLTFRGAGEKVVSGDPKGEYITCNDEEAALTAETYLAIQERLRQPGVGEAIHRAATGEPPVLIRSKS